MKLSVALCTYNGKPHFEEQIESILNQRCRPDEIVICDDGSTDGTLERAHEYGEEFPEVINIFENKKNQGVVKNFEKAIKSCSGDLIAICDQDDVWDEKKLEHQVEVMEVTDAAMAFHNSQIVNESLKPLGELWNQVNPSFDPKAINSEEQLLYELFERNFAQGATMIIDSVYCDRILPIPEVWEYDHFIALVLGAAGKIQPIDETLLRYRQHERQSIGAPAQSTTFLTTLRNRFDLAYEDFELYRQRWKTLYNRLAKISDEEFTVDPELVRTSCRKRLEYNEFRAEAYNPKLSKWERVQRICHNFHKNNYDGFANRWISTPKDFIMLFR